MMTAHRQQAHARLETLKEFPGLGVARLQERGGPQARPLPSQVGVTEIHRSGSRGTGGY